MDFTVIPNSVKKTLESAGCPLSEEQFMVMAGALGAAQQMIDAMGLAGAIEVLNPMAGTDNQLMG